MKSSGKFCFFGKIKTLNEIVVPAVDHCAVGAQMNYNDGEVSDSSDSNMEEKKQIEDNLI